MKEFLNIKILWFTYFYSPCEPTVDWTIKFNVNLFLMSLQTLDNMEN